MMIKFFKKTWDWIRNAPRRFVNWIKAIKKEGFRKWLKRKIKRILIILGIITAVSATTMSMLPDQIPEHLLLKAPIEKIVHHIDKTYTNELGESNEYIKYFYISDIELDSDNFYFSPNYKFSSGRYLRKGEKPIIAFNGEKVYRNELGRVFDILSASTTLSAWQEQTKGELIGRIFGKKALATTDTYTSSDTWTAPAGVTSVDAEVWAGGGSGGAEPNDPSEGGGGGAYSKKTGISVTPSTGYNVVVGTGGVYKGAISPSDGATGGDSYFIDNATVLAKGGQGGDKDGDSKGIGGAAASGVGDTKYSGGNGGNGHTSAPGYGGGGGGGAGTTEVGGNGGNGSQYSSGSAGVGGVEDGGNGGQGGLNGNGVSGSTIGGGGGGQGSGTSSYSGGGARGEVRLTYEVAAPAAPTRNRNQLLEV